MSGIYIFGGDFVAIETGVPGSDALKVGVGPDIETAIEHLDVTPFGAHEDRVQAVRWAYRETPNHGVDFAADLEEVDECELDELTGDAAEWVRRELKWWEEEV